MTRIRNLLIGLVVATLVLCAADLVELSARAELRAVERAQAALSAAHAAWAADMRGLQRMPEPGN